MEHTAEIVDCPLPYCQVAKCKEACKNIKELDLVYLCEAAIPTRAPCLLRLGPTLDEGCAMLSGAHLPYMAVLC